MGNNIYKFWSILSKSERDVGKYGFLMVAKSLKTVAFNHTGRKQTREQNSILQLKWTAYLKYTEPTC